MKRFKSKRQIRYISMVSASLLMLILGFYTILFQTTGSALNLYDYKALDFFYRVAVNQGYGPSQAFTPGVIYLNITDETYNYFDKNYLDRKDMATLNDALGYMGAELVIYDIIFARKSNEESDTRFADSIQNLGNVFLPSALVVTEKPSRFRWKENPAYDRFKSDYLERPIEKNTDKSDYKPLYASAALMQQIDFASQAKGSGDISAEADSDGIYRHTTLLIKVDDQYFPTLSLAAFLDWSGVSVRDLVVEWGKRLVIPASRSEKLFKDVVIPIDRHGKTFIPYVDKMGKDFDHMSAHTFLESFKDENLRGNLLEKIEGNFAFIGDIAIGTSDLGYTPLQNDAPLVITHASLLNGMLTNRFYSYWSIGESLIIVSIFLILFSFTALLHSSRFFYVTCISSILLIPVITWFEFINFRLFPISTIGLILSISFFSLTVLLETLGAKERTFIRNTFSRYLPEAVVNNLLADPEKISLGGEERVVTVLFSDIANFTSISERLSPGELVNMLNEYFTEMADIIMENGGIIDKFQGDSIMAEFGMPLPIEDHADRAVRTALQMQTRLKELRKNKTGSSGSKTALQNIYSRIGINSNNMIVGNMGCKKVFDYTVIGDAVNLASRLEGANKLYGTEIMISEYTLAKLTPGRFKFRLLDYIKVKGKSRPVFVYEVYRENIEKKCDHEFTDEQNRESCNEQSEESYYQIYNAGFDAYMKQNFEESLDLFSRALSLKTGDKASNRMIERIKWLVNSKNVDGSWDGAVSLQTK